MTWTRKHIALQVASVDTVISPAGFIATRMNDTTSTGGDPARSVPALGLPSQLSSSQAIESFFDMMHIKVCNLLLRA